MQAAKQARFLVCEGQQAFVVVHVLAAAMHPPQWRDLLSLPPPPVQSMNFFGLRLELLHPQHGQTPFDAPPLPCGDQLCLAAHLA